MAGHDHDGTSPDEYPPNSIRHVHYQPAGGDARGELTDIGTLRRRGGASEFTAPQGVSFEFVLRITSGSTVHEVDFVSHPLTVGDVLWIHPGQVQRWGHIEAIEGDALLVPTETIPPSTVQLLGKLGAHTRNYWPSATYPGSLLESAFAVARTWYSATTATGSAGQAVRSTLLHALLLQIAGDPSVGSAVTAPPHPAFTAFEAAVEAAYFRTRNVSYYARSIGYSERTLARITGTYAGLAPKALIDRRVILEARRLLAHTNDTVTRIDIQLGFEDATNFTAYFRRHTDSTPGAFRASTR